MNSKSGTFPDKWYQLPWKKFIKTTELMELGAMKEEIRNCQRQGRERSVLFRNASLQVDTLLFLLQSHFPQEASLKPFSLFADDLPKSLGAETVFKMFSTD